MFAIHLQRLFNLIACLLNIYMSFQFRCYAHIVFFYSPLNITLLKCKYVNLHINCNFLYASRVSFRNQMKQKLVRFISHIDIMLCFIHLLVLLRLYIVLFVYSSFIFLFRLARDLFRSDFIVILFDFLPL